MSGQSILVVEDEPQMRRFLRTMLRSQGFAVLEASTLAEATLVATSHRLDLILLDLGLPDGEGIDFVKAVREWSRIPIIVLSARGRDEDKVDALDVGADDYVTKPFSVNELLARMRVAFRHASLSATDDEEIISVGDVVIDVVRREVTRRGEAVHLTPTEYNLLLLLARNAGRVLTHRQSLAEIWGRSSTEHTHYVRVQMAQLRKKLEDNPARPKLFITEAGVGYRLRAAD